MGIYTENLHPQIRSSIFQNAGGVCAQCGRSGDALVIAVRRGEFNHVGSGFDHGRNSIVCCRECVPRGWTVCMPPDERIVDSVRSLLA